ncbi:MAG: hypothetical protein R3284_02395 [Rubricoccaceae bacterium]|nr:hypothetical protein [Rubricoccaceae bacterium]
MRSLLLGALLATVVLFIWGFLAWGSIIYNPFSSMTDQDTVTSALSQSLPESGVYLVPNYPDRSNDAEVADWTERHQSGPLAMIYFSAEGATPMSSMLPGFIHMLISVLLMAFLLKMAVSALPGYGQRVMFVMFAGLVGAFWINLGNPIWWNQPWGFHFYSFVYSVIGWLLAGFVLARFIKSEPDMATEIAE